MKAMPLQALAIGLVLTASPAVPAASAGPQSTFDGEYGCSDMYGINLGLLRLAGDGYTWTRTDTAFRPIAARENGSGKLKFNRTYFVPASGPLSRWNVTGVIATDGLNINNSGGALMGCRKR